ncbi:MAG: tRNA (N(6)-L-threonylcarbamoyladenosine(37)-C(2))-methylthiotransferase MtaB [Bacteroidales bacterium]|nr:tRNA (N(6)-L-threonylcarbamoyladenosine(37)-C(2))-methylthiotransferase MtaB [Bacteroidales bacterium]
MLPQKSIAFYTLGCKVNYSESSFIANQFNHNGFTIKNFNDKADIYVINTCAVTSTAVKKSRNIINKALHNNPDSFIVVTGCITETEKLALSEINEIGLIVGANEKFSLFDLICRKINSEVELGSYNLTEKSFYPSFSSGERTRSFLKIQDGCDYFCSYCVIPYARGRSRSDTVNNIVKNASNIVAKGIREIVLTGINIGDFRNNQGERLVDVLLALEKIEGLYRIRMSSVEPDLLTDDILQLTSQSEKILNHFHLPLQSGSNRILKLMNRKYQIELFRERLFKIKELMPDACIGTDIITGFPTETESDFNDSLGFLESLPLSYMHVFSYSKRNQTQASKMGENVPPSLKKERTNVLLSLADQKKTIFYSTQIGKIHQVLFESKNDKGYIHGFSKNYLKVKMLYDKYLINKIVSIPLTTIDNDGVFVEDKKNIIKTV